MRIAKVLLKALAWLSAVVAALVVAVYLYILGVNWHDRPPSEAALRLEEVFHNKPPVRNEENAYVYLMGFSVGEAEDPKEWGMRRIAWAHRLVDQVGEHGSEGQPGASFDIRTARSPAVQALLEACRAVDRACLSALEGGKETIAAWLDAEGWLLNRYRVLLAHPGWRETLPLDDRAPLPSYAEVLEAQKILFVRAWQLARRADAVGVKGLLEEDVRFWRQILDASDTLVAKLVATAALERHFTWSNIILRQLPTDQLLQGIPELWTEPISESERSMMSSLTGEWMLLANSLKQLADRADFASRSRIMESAPDEEPVAQRLQSLLLAPMFQPQDTINHRADLLLTMAEALHVPYEQYLDIVERARTRMSEPDEEEMMSSMRIYNFVGNVLSAIATPDYLSYGVRVADLEGVRRSALLAAELRSQRVAPEEVRQHLSEATLRNPYSGEPLLWNDDTEAIVFVGLAQPERRRYVMLY